MNWTGEPLMLTLEACAPEASASVDAKAAVRLMAANRPRRRRLRPAGSPLRLSRIRVPSLAIFRWTGTSLTGEPAAHRNSGREIGPNAGCRRSSAPVGLVQGKDSLGHIYRTALRLVAMVHGRRDP